jgi:hypothetical protein
MAHTKKVRPEGVKVIFEAVTGRPRGRGIFGIEDEGDEVARQAKLQRMAERIAEYDRGYEGNRRRCPQCGQWQQYKGDASREVSVEGGTLTILRAYYVCPRCHTTSYPLDEQLGLGEEHELHFKNLKRRESGRYKILSFLRSALISSETVKLNVFHKSFMVTTKIVDMLVEPLLAQGGVDLCKRGANLAMANVLHTVTPVFCGQELFQTFQDCFVQMIRQRDCGTVETFYNSIVNLRAANTHDRFQSLLDTLIATRNILEPVLLHVTDTELDPAIPSFVFHCSAWSDRFGGPFDIMHDESKPIARARELLVSLMAPEESSATVGYDRRTMVFPLKSTGIHFYDSKRVEQIQIADLLASAFAYLTSGYAGVAVERAFWEELRNSVLPSLVIGAVWPGTQVTPEEPEKGNAGTNVAESVTNFLINRDVNKHSN